MTPRACLIRHLGWDFVKIVTPSLSGMNMEDHLEGTVVAALDGFVTSYRNVRPVLLSNTFFFFFRPGERGLICSKEDRGIERLLLTQRAVWLTQTRPRKDGKRHTSPS